MCHRAYQIVIRKGRTEHTENPGIGAGRRVNFKTFVLFQLAKNKLSQNSMVTLRHHRNKLIAVAKGESSVQTDPGGPKFRCALGLECTVLKLPKFAS